MPVAGQPNRWSAARRRAARDGGSWVAASGSSGGTAEDEGPTVKACCGQPLREVVAFQVSMLRATVCCGCHCCQ
jgi:hypothetical protein